MEEGVNQMRNTESNGFLTSDARDLTSFIVRNYMNASKIVEVGVGAYPWVAHGIQKGLPRTRVVVVDINPEHIANVRKVCPDLEAVIDDVWNPCSEVYLDAALMYALHPPPEMVPQILKTARSIGADIIIRPLFSDEAGYNYPGNEGWKFIRLEQTSFYLLRPQP